MSGGDLFGANCPDTEELCGDSGGLVKKKNFYVADQSHLIEQQRKIALQGRPGKTGAKGQKGDVGPTGDKVSNLS